MYTQQPIAPARTPPSLVTSPLLIPINRPSLLRIQELVPTRTTLAPTPTTTHPAPIPTHPHSTHYVWYSPLNSPLHNLIPDQQRHSPIQNLVPRPPKRIEDGGVGGAGEGVGAVLREAVVDDAFLRHAA